MGHVARKGADRLHRILERHFPRPMHVGQIPLVIDGVGQRHFMKTFVTALLVTFTVAAAPQSAGHPFDPTRIVASADSFVVVTRVTGNDWRVIGGVVQTIARDTNAIRMSLDAAFMDSKHRIEMAMHPTSLAPIAHWEKISRRGQGDANGEVMFSDGRVRG